MIHRCTTKKKYIYIMVRNVCKILKNTSDIEKLIKHHDFPEEGTLSLTRLKVVRDSVEQGSDKQPGCCCKCVKHVKNVNKQ